MFANDPRPGTLTAVANPLSTRRGFWTFAALTWLLAMAVGVVGVGLLVHASVGAFVFVACLMTAACAFWMWVVWRLSRRRG
jgi:integral membrane sensor domain MASE1